MTTYRQYPADRRDADIRSEHDRFILTVLGLAILLFAVTGLTAGAICYFDATCRAFAF